MQHQSLLAVTPRRFLRVVFLVVVGLLAVGSASPEACGQAFRSLHSFMGPDNGTYPDAAVIRGKDGALYGTTYEGGASNAGTVFKVHPDGTGYQTLHTFSGSDGDYPVAALLQGQGGALYGTTFVGGADGVGTVFKLNPDGTGFQTLHSFSRSDGYYPVAAVIQGRDGALYGTTEVGGGTTEGGGADGAGTVFKMNPDGTGFQTLHTISGFGFPASIPGAALLQGRDGALYGTTPDGGADGEGTVFKLNPDGTGFQTLYSFSFSGSDGKQPQAAVIQGRDGALYGTTYHDSTGYVGTVFKLNPDGTGFQTLYTFTYSDAGNPGAYLIASLLQGQDGALYGTSMNAGVYNDGTVFKLNPDGTGFQTLHTFSGSDGYFLIASLLQDQDGSLYGTANAGGANGYGTIFKVNPDGTGFQTVHTFSVSNSDGANPYAALLQGRDGSLYGTTADGGAYNDGTVFKANSDGSGFQTLHTFSGSDGADPVSSLLQGQDGALYGTTQYGGADGAGTVFKVNPDGAGFQTLHSFSGGDGSNPVAALLQGQDGALYGTTQTGGANGYGTIFKVNPDGTGFQTVHTFSVSNSDGANPYAALLQGRDGSLYGTTADGGAYNDGTVYKMNPDGTDFQTLYSFSRSGSVGGNPVAAVIQGQDGALYGTTQHAPAPRGGNTDGTVFKVNPDGTGFQTLHTFTGSDGTGSGAAVIQGWDGALYGTTSDGGGSVFTLNPDGNGTVFKVNPDGTGFQILHTFSFSGGDGANPGAAVTQGKDGALYGTTVGGGEYGYGTLFKLTLALIDVTDEVQVSSSGLTYNSVTKLYTGTLTIKNNNRNAIGGPIQAVLNHLPAGVTLVNANGTYNGTPYVTANITSLAPRAVVHLPLQFRVASGNGRIGYSITVYSGTP